MYQDTFNHQLSGGAICKFTIRSRKINGETFYYANFININLESYQNLSQEEKKSYLGMEITNGKGKHVNYRDVQRLKADIISKYGDEWLESEV